MPSRQLAQACLISFAFLLAGCATASTGAGLSSSSPAAAPADLNGPAADAALCAKLLAQWAPLRDGALAQIHETASLDVVAVATAMNTFNGELLDEVNGFSNANLTDAWTQASSDGLEGVHTLLNSDVQHALNWLPTFELSMQSAIDACNSAR